MLQIYYLKLSDYQAYPEEYFMPLVSPETWQDTRQFQNKKVRMTKLSGESMIRKLITENWRLSPNEYRIEKGKHGKPYLKTHGIPAYFNISHSGDYIICAISNQEVGIDIEQRGKIRMEVARRFFHPQEVALLEGTSDEQKTRELFFNYWSVKESYLKYTGSGLSSPLSSFEVLFTDKGVVLKKGHSPLPVAVKECPIDSDYSSYVCCQSPDLFTICPFKL